jgi:hemolysin activation/secretion protein
VPCLLLWSVGYTSAADSDSARYDVQAYQVEGKLSLSTNTLIPLLSQYTGHHVSLDQIVRAAADVQAEYRHLGFPTMDVGIAPGRITNGTVILNVFPETVPQIFVSGKRYLVSSNEVVVVPPAPVTGQASAPARTNAPPARAAAKFNVARYAVLGNTLLTRETIASVLTNIPGAFGTNVTIDGIRGVVGGLQNAYRVRGYVTVAVGLPPQKLTNATVKIQVTEGRLASIEVRGNHYFSSNNVMRSLPGLHTNLILNAQIFQAQLDQANENRDRKIYPKIQPGPDPGTSDLRLDVVDRIPLHAKMELNNESSPGTPNLRVNSSAVYDNLWQQEQSLGLQYSFSPTVYKNAPQWDWYDRPLVANYSAYYRIPLGRPESIEDIVNANPGSFGYDEATRKFNLPPASGRPDVTFFANRSTIDTGVQTLSSTNIYNEPGVETITQTTLQQDLTVNNDLGARLSAPLPATQIIHPDISAGLDYKIYQGSSYKTNNFVSDQITLNAQGQPNPPVISTVSTPLPASANIIDYLPLNVRYNVSWNDSLGSAGLGLGANLNLWYDAQSRLGGGTNLTVLTGKKALQEITGSKKSGGHWLILNPTFFHQFGLIPNWPTTVRADGQWANEPLISNEEFGSGGVNSVRGYQEGQVFGDTGWHVSVEQQTPPDIVGYLNHQEPLTFRGSVFMDYADTYLLDPQGRPASTALWGTGIGGVAALGSAWEARFLFSLPLQAAGNIRADAPFFNFSLTAQF